MCAKHCGECTARGRTNKKESDTKREAKRLTRFSHKMSSSLRKIKEKIEKKKTKKPRKAPVFNREDGPQCNVCLRRFSSIQWLRNHKARIHEGKTSKDFECPKCHKKFSLKSSLTRHDKTVHLKLREHVCEVCGRAFGHGFSLQAHIRHSHAARQGA
jgi:hypothetical protein